VRLGDHLELQRLAARYQSLAATLPMNLSMLAGGAPGAGEPVDSLAALAAAL
jgi:hypothetical protein